LLLGNRNSRRWWANPLQPNGRLFPKPKLLAHIEQLVDAWYQDEDLALWIFIGLFVATWSSFHFLSNSSVSLHPDNLEGYAWAQHLRPGYSSQPPLTALIVAGWFALFPATDWSFHLLAMVNSAVALYAIALIARRYVRGDKRLLVLLLLLLLPFYQFRGQRFSVNASLLSTWPIATYCFIRAFETRTIMWSAAAGATAALAMLGKDYSIYLIAAFVVAAVTHPDRRSYLKSPAPWASIFVGFLFLSPHLYWLATTGFQPFAYAINGHAGRPLSRALEKAGTFAIGALAYMALPFGVFCLATRANVGAIAEALWPSDARLRMLAVLFWTPLILPILTAPLIGGELTPLWVMSGCFLLPILLLAPEHVLLTRQAAIKVAIGVGFITAGVLLFAPALALIRYAQATTSQIVRLDDKDARIYERIVAKQATRIWHEILDRPLTIVTGTADPNPYAVTFYSPDHPDGFVNYSLTGTPWITIERLSQEGWLALCALEDQSCVSAAYSFIARGPRPQRVDFVARASFFRWQRPPKRYVALIFPPKASH
jgi:hypothetical protein